MTACSHTSRFRAPAVLLALALGLAACADETPQAEASDSSSVVTEIAPAVPEPAEVATPIEEEVVAAPVNDTAAPAPAAVGVEEEPTPVDQQTLEDADATGMTSRYAGEDAAGDGPAGNGTAPAE